MRDYKCAPYYKKHILARRFQQLIVLEAKYGAPEQYTPAIVYVMEHYKKVAICILVYTTICTIEWNV